MVPYMQTSRPIIITRPHHEVVTKYLCDWSKNVVDMAIAKALVVFDLVGEKSTKKVFEGYVKKRAPVFAFLNGHGNALEIAGHENEVIINKDSDLNLKIIYARSCEAASILGPELVSRGVGAFVGYTRKFIFGYDLDKCYKPLDDTLAKLFLEPSNLVASTIIKGHSVLEADKRSKEAMYKNFRKMISSSATYEERFAARWLWSNIKSQVVLGDQNCTI